MMYRIEDRGPVRADGTLLSVGVVAPAEEIANLEESVVNRWAVPFRIAGAEAAQQVSAEEPKPVAKQVKPAKKRAEGR